MLLILGAPFPFTDPSLRFLRFARAAPQECTPLGGWGGAGCLSRGCPCPKGTQDCLGNQRWARKTKLRPYLVSTTVLPGAGVRRVRIEASSSPKEVYLQSRR